MNNIVTVENLSKKFFFKRTGGFRPKLSNVLSLLLGVKSSELSSRENCFWALKDISFKIDRGDSLGIVGLNGAGKSTLLKVLLKRLYPDSGKVLVNGNAGGLIELGSGFHPENTGRKNIELNAKLLGASKKEIDGKLDDIINFADIGDFIDLPVKTYSSGMSVRLGFSVAINFVKDLVICDEVLSVGDFEFRQKCLNEINRIRKTRSFVLVSHSSHSISLFCNKAILLHKGHLIINDVPEKVLEVYSYCKHNTSVEEARDIAQSLTLEKSKLKKQKKVEVKKKNLAHCGPEYLDKDTIRGVSIDWNLGSINDRYVIRSGEKLEFIIKFELLRGIEKLRIGIPFFDITGQMVIGPDTRHCSKVLTVKDKGTYEIRFTISEFPVNAGELTAVITLCDDPAFLYRKHFKTLVVVNPKNYFGTYRSVPELNIESYDKERKL
jgi:ABC-type polysaccharide/polyol phosphate transport system ATPase subunit